MKKGQLDFVLNAIHDDIEFISYSPIKVFPFLGHRRGKPAMSEALHGAVKAFEFIACEPISMGDRTRKRRRHAVHPRPSAV
jgi:hypothetical protein